MRRSFRTAQADSSAVEFISWLSGEAVVHSQDALGRWVFGPHGGRRHGPETGGHGHKPCFSDDRHPPPCPIESTGLRNLSTPRSPPEMFWNDPDGGRPGISAAFAELDLVKVMKM